jgi:hypothetical protein
MNNKVLIIAYYWPPSGGSGVQRWLKFVKYLPQFGWKPYVFTPENPSFAIRDESLIKDVPDEAEVIHFPIWEPYESFFKLGNLFKQKTSAKPTDLVSTSGQSAFQRISTFIRANFLIPDPRVFWVRPSVKFLHDFLRDNQIRTIVTTGPPHSLHLIGHRLKKKDPSLRWLADFRDPWSEWGLLDSLKVSTPVRAIHKKLEAKILKNADHVITITPFYVRRFEALSGCKIALLTNGYDEDDFHSLLLEPTNQFVIRHVGIVNEKCDPRPFMLAVENAMRLNAEFAAKMRIDFVGEVHPAFRAFVVARPGLNAVVTFTPSIPHKQLISLYGKSSLLLLILTGYKDAEGYMPGKLFEYMATRLPIFAVGPSQGDAASMLQETNSGEMIDSGDGDRITGALLSAFDFWKSGNIKKPEGKAEKFSRRNITKELIELF